MNALTIQNPVDVYQLETNYIKYAHDTVNAEKKFKREALFACQILQDNNYLMGIARSNPDSLKSAVYNLAALDLTLNPAEKKAYLIPRKGKVCLDISYIGLADLCVKAGMRFVQAEIVRENDAFEVTGIDSAPIHAYNPFSKDRGAITGAYCVVKTQHGDYLTEAMSIDEIYAIRNRSESFKKGSGPWKTDESEMIKKTVIRRASKLWPKGNGLIDKAVEALNQVEGIDFDQERTEQEQAAKEERERKKEQARAEREEKTALINEAKELYGDLVKIMNSREIGELMFNTFNISSFDKLINKSVQEARDVVERLKLEIMRGGNA